MALARVYEVASVSAPPNFLSVSKMALSAPLAKASLNADSAWGGPMLTTVTVHPNFSFIWTPASRAFRSKGLGSAFAELLSSVPFSVSNFTSSISGTCLRSTIMWDLSFAVSPEL